MLTAQDLDELRQHLLARRDALIQEGDVLIEPNRKDPSQIPDEDEQPLNEMEQIIASKRNRLRAQELEGITRALTMIELQPEDYGECEECGEAIALGRLKIMPWTTRCVRCLQRRESLHKSTRRRHALDYHE